MEQREAVQLQRQILSGDERLFADQAVSAGGHSGVRRRCAWMPRSKSRASMPIRSRCGANFMPQVARWTSRVRVAAARHGRAGAALQPFDPANFGGYRREGVGQGGRNSGTRHGAAGRDRLSEAGRWPCHRGRQAAAGAGGAGDAGSTSGCGPKSLSSPAPTATPRRWSARRRRWREVFADYYDLGVSHFLIRGFDPLVDAIEYGRELIPLTRKLIAERGAPAELPPNDPRFCSRGRPAARRIRRLRPSAQTTLSRVGDQKGNAQAVMEAAGVLKDVPPARSSGRNFPAAAPLLEALECRRDRERAGRRCAVHLRSRREHPGQGDRRHPPVARTAWRSWCRRIRRSRALTISRARRSRPAAVRSGTS